MQSVAWRGCRLYDTPGINGWGGRKSRAELEATARRAVEIADVVLLCFDSQSQQASEFSKVADWVRHYGKPTIAVLNIRNLRWRHPAKVPNQTARQNISEPVRQHATTFAPSLPSIGLPDTPVVAIHSRRALFARASTPYRGPAERDFLNEREQHGIDYLARWSNFGTLEALLTAGIAAGGAQLRLTSLREGMRAILHDEARLLEALGRAARRSGSTRSTGPSRDTSRCSATSNPTNAAPTCTTSNGAGTCSRSPRPLAGAVPLTRRRHLQPLSPDIAETATVGAAQRCAATVQGLGARGLRRPQGRRPGHVLSEVFDEARDPGGARTRVGHGGDISRARIVHGHSRIAAPGRRRRARVTPIWPERQAPARGFENGVSGQRVADRRPAAIAVVALANAWNPIGWAAGVVVAGIGDRVLGAGHGSGPHGDQPKAAAEARAKAATPAAPRSTTPFDRIEKDFARDARTSRGDEAAPTVEVLLREAVVLTRLRDQIARSPPNSTTRPTALRRRPPSTSSRRDADYCRHCSTQLTAIAIVDRIICWARTGSTPRRRTMATPVDREAFAEACRLRHDADVDRLRRALTDALSHARHPRVADWTQRSPTPRERRDLRGRAGSAAPPRGRATRRRRRRRLQRGQVVLHQAPARRDRRRSPGDAPHPGRPHHRRRASSTSWAMSTSWTPPAFRAGARDTTTRRCPPPPNAALVIVLLHVNLLIGDTARLEGVVKGTEAAPGKWPRMLFLINRCDELGVDPLHGDRRVLQPAGPQGGRTARCAGVARDRRRDAPHSRRRGRPFSAVGRHSPVTRADYDANRAWDGIDAFVEALRSLSPDRHRTRECPSGSWTMRCEDLLHDTVRDRAPNPRRTEWTIDRHDILDQSARRVSRGRHVPVEDVSNTHFRQGFAAHARSDRAHPERSPRRRRQAGRRHGLVEQQEISKPKSRQFMGFRGRGDRGVGIDPRVRDQPRTRRHELRSTPGHARRLRTTPEDTVADVTRTGGAITSGRRSSCPRLGTRDAVYGIGKKFAI